MKLLKLTKNVWFVELHNSLVLDGHYGVYFTHYDWKVANFAVKKFGGFGGLTVYPDVDGDIKTTFTGVEASHVLNHIQRVVRYYLGNYKDPNNTCEPYGQYDLEVANLLQATFQERY